MFAQSAQQNLLRSASENEEARLRVELERARMAPRLDGSERFRDLRSTNDTSQLSDSLAASADANKVSVLELAFAAPVAAGADTSRQDVDLRLRGTYAAVRQTIADVVAAQPTLSLESVTMRRGRANDTVIEADVRLAFLALAGR
jgi:hypothetical protein